MSTNVQQTPFVKQLAANDRPTRDAALDSLKTYLRGTRTFTPVDLLKLWKGLFYSMWMCDRPRPQAALATDIASLLTLVPTTNRIPFARAFWQTMAREWTNIDVLRMEKFLLLTRRFVGATLAAMKESGWKVDVVLEHLQLLSDIPFNVEDPRIGNGIRYHVIDIWVDELERIEAIGDEAGPLDDLLEPLRKLAKNSPTKDVRRKAKEALADERLPGNKKAEEKNEEEGEGEGDDEEGWGGIED